MRVYRIEDQEGQGIYGAGSVAFDCSAEGMMPYRSSRAADIPDRHPGPDTDEGLKTWWDGPSRHAMKKRINWHNWGRREYVCGFQDEAQMLRWFPREGFQRMVERLNNNRPALLARGYHVAVYDVHANRVKKGEYQVMFRKEDARLVERVALDHYAGA